MVEWDSKERGVPLRANEGLRGYYIGCSACRRWMTIEFATALRRFGASTYTGDLARRLRCTECGERKGYVMAWAASNRP